MEGQTRYCFTIKTDKYTANDLVGVKALNYQTLVAHNINIAPSTVISGFAFDDFIVANNLVEQIVSKLEELAQHPENLKKISTHIQGLIRKAPLPAELLEQLQTAYASLGNIDTTFVDLKQSALNPELDTTSLGIYPDRFIVKGLEAISESIKELWAQLFTEAALDYRQRSGYEGNLSQAIVLQKVLNPEVSGIAFNFELGSGSETLATIIANLGVSKIETLPSFPVIGQAAPTDKQNNGLSDYYEVNKANQKLIKQLRNEQKFMQIRSRPGENNQLTEVKISKVWAERTKLDDTQLKKLVNLINILDKQHSNKFVIEWIFESGQFTITNFVDLTEESASLYAPVAWSDVPIGTEKIMLKPTTAIPSEDPKVSNITEPAAPQAETATLTITPKEEAIAYLKEHKQDFILTPNEREDKATTVKEMLPEVKTVTEVWWNTDQDVNELKVFLNNIEGYGIFSFREVAERLNSGGDINRLKDLKSLQKKICEYLATFLTAIAPKPIFILIDRELSLEVQVDLLAQLRNLYGHKNFWVILPEIRDVEEVASFKKILASNSFRRTNAFHIFQLISQPLYLANLNAIIEQSIDGIIVDVDQLYKNLIGRNIDSTNPGDNYELLLNFLIENLIEKSQTKLFTFLHTRSRSLLEKMLGEMLENGINGVIYNETDLLDFKHKLTEQETKILTKSLKRIKKNLRRK